MEVLPGQRSLFPKITSAEFSEDRLYRYTLSRIWKEDGKLLNFVMLNPSSAGETNDDNTIRRCMGYADTWDYNGIIVTNLFAWRATDPCQLKRVNNPVGGLENNIHLLSCAKNSDRVVCAWGNHGDYRGRDREVISMFQVNQISLYCLGLTRSGQPKHPLRLNKNLTPQPWLPTT